MFQRKKKCGVCGYRFTPKKEEVYTAEEPRAFVDCISKAPTRFSAVDCPECGCQIMLTVRAQRIAEPERNAPKEAWVIDECDSTDATPARWYIDFHCPECDTEYGLEEGQYGWYENKEIPYKFCPICGERLITENCEVEE